MLRFHTLGVTAGLDSAIGLISSRSGADPWTDSEPAEKRIGIGLRMASHNRTRLSAFEWAGCIRFVSAELHLFVPCPEKVRYAQGVYILLAHKLNY